ncbi:MAG: SCP2 sterol-binding domain-containing protein [bacterium]
MVKLEEHPTVKRLIEKGAAPSGREPAASLDAEALRRLCLEMGADDVGFVEAGRPEIQADRESLRRYAPWTKTLISFVLRMNRAPIQSPARSVANLEFHHAGDRVNEVARRIVTALEKRGVRAMNPSMGFPMEMDEFSRGRIWVVSHKLAAVAAGLGRMGIHRNVIHPKFGNFILLGTVLVEAEVTAHDRPVDYNPCLECKLCVAACPVGAIAPDGNFDFSACYTHNYREFTGGFTDWVENIADSRNARDYRRKVTDAESSSMWQSLSFGANYKAAYCMAVCPAGEDVISPYLADKGAYLSDVVKPLQNKEETIYVVPDSDAEAHVSRRFPHKKVKRVGNGLRPRSIRRFLGALPLVFQRGRSEGLNATYHFTFTGEEEAEATVAIREGRIEVNEGRLGEADLHVRADSATWLGFLAKERSLPWALLRRKIRLKGSPRLLIAFGRCFPS